MKYIVDGEFTLTKAQVDAIKRIHPTRSTPIAAIDGRSIASFRSRGLIEDGGTGSDGKRRVKLSMMGRRIQQAIESGSYEIIDHNKKPVVEEKKRTVSDLSACEALRVTEKVLAKRVEALEEERKSVAFKLDHHKSELLIVRQTLAQLDSLEKPA